MAGMIFNGVSSSALHIEHASPIIPLLPQKRPTTIELPGRDGVFDFANDSYMPRLIQVDVLIESAPSETELATWLSAVADWLSGSGTLIFDRSPTRQWTNAKAYQQIDMEHIPLTRMFSVFFEAEPWPEDTTEITNATVDEVQDYGSEVVFFPTIKITLGAASNSLQVTLESTGKYVLISGPFTDGDVIVIDMAKGKVTVNGEAHKVHINSEFFGVPPGGQKIIVTADGAYTAVMYYRKRYRYA